MPYYPYNRPPSRNTDLVTILIILMIVLTTLRILRFHF